MQFAARITVIVALMTILLVTQLANNASRYIQEALRILYWD